MVLLLCCCFDAVLGVSVSNSLVTHLKKRRPTRVSDLNDKAAPPPLLSHEVLNGMPFAFNDLTFALRLQIMLLFALCCGLHRRRDKFEIGRAHV